MKLINYLLLLSLFNCFTVYTKDETVLEKKYLETRNVKEKKDVFVLTHTIDKEGLYLLLDAYKVEEDNQVDFIREKYKENKAVKFKYEFNKNDLNCGEVHLCGVIIVIAAAVIMVEIPTLPFRTMSEEKERIRKEIQKGNANRIGVISTENISFVLLDRKLPREYKFQEDKVFIPFEDLELDSFTFKNLPYKLVNIENKSNLSQGTLDFSEQVNANKEISRMIQENDKKKKSAKCKFEFPFLTSQNIAFKEADKESKEMCKKKYSDPKTFVWNNAKYNECMQNIKECYEATRFAK